MAATALGEPFPTQSVDWLIVNTFGEQDGGIRDTPDPNSEKYPNVAGFSVVALLGFRALPATMLPKAFCHICYTAAGCTQMACRHKPFSQNKRGIALRTYPNVWQKEEQEASYETQKRSTPIHHFRRRRSEPP
jgi:hypothetical protein